MIFFSDMDGTFLTSDKHISPASWAALDAIHDAGMYFVPCTARAFNGVDPKLLAHPAVRYVVASNGASVVDLAHDKEIHSVHMTLEHVMAIYEVVRDYDDITFDVFASGACYSHRSRYDRLDEFAGKLSTLESLQANRTPYDVPTEEFLPTLDGFERITIYWKNPQDRDALVAALSQDPDLTIVRSTPNNIELSDPAATKGGALTWLCGHLGMTAADAVAFGDYVNDISMIEAAGCGVAMQNAVAEAREAADLVTATNDEDGVARVIMGKLRGR